MNRRGFLSSMLKAGAAFAILPPALTYSRHWQPTASGLVTPTATITLPLSPRYQVIWVKMGAEVYHSPVFPLTELRLKISGKVQRTVELE